jgi:hypothetical protein
LRRVSDTHYAVDAKAYYFRPNESTPHVAEIGVFLDTGTSLPLATRDAAARLQLIYDAEPAVYSRGFAGAKTGLFAVDESHGLEFSLEAPGLPHAVLNGVRLVAPDSLAGSDVVMSPKDLAPAGGAVKLDLKRSEFTVCETLDACLGDDEYTELARPSCPDMPELLGVPAVVNGQRLELLLDSGGSTLLFRDFAEQSGLGASAEVVRHGELVGSGDARAQAQLLRGHFQYVVGSESPLTLSRNQLWRVEPAEREGAVACYPAGSLGLDALTGCQLVLGDAPSAAYLHCGS